MTQREALSASLRSPVPRVAPRSAQHPTISAHQALAPWRSSVVHPRDWLFVHPARRQTCILQPGAAKLKAHQARSLGPGDSQARSEASAPSTSARLSAGPIEPPNLLLQDCASRADQGSARIPTCGRRRERHTLFCRNQARNEVRKLRAALSAGAWPQQAPKNPQQVWLPTELAMLTLR